MTTKEIIEALRKYNKWRRGDDTIEHPNPTELGIVIEEAIEKLEEYETNIEKNCD